MDKDFKMRLFGLSAVEATAIRDALEKYRVKQWGFVIFRCTYTSQEAWDKFLTLAKQDAYDYFELRGIEDVYDTMAWTVIEDPETLDGASILDTSRRFEEWFRTEGRKEIQGSVFTDTWNSYPRYHFFIHVDQESLESVVDDEKAKKEVGYFCTIVYKDNVLLDEEDRQAQANRDKEGDEGDENDGDDEDDEDDEDDLIDLRKRVNVDKLVSLYAILLMLDSWYHLPLF